MDTHGARHEGQVGDAHTATRMLHKHEMTGSAAGRVQCQWGTAQAAQSSHETRLLAQGAQGRRRMGRAGALMGGCWRAHAVLKRPAAITSLVCWGGILCTHTRGLRQIGEPRCQLPDLRCAYILEAQRTAQRGVERTRLDGGQQRMACSARRPARQGRWTRRDGAAAHRGMQLAGSSRRHGC